MPTILTATSGGLLTFDDAGNAGPVHHPGRAVTAVAPDRDALWAIVEETEVWHSADREHWTRAATIDEPHRGTCIAVTDAVLVGTSEARVFSVVNDRLEPLAAFDAVEGRSAWHTPWGGPPDTRSMSEWDDAVYVNVHVGGIVRTLDGGATWTPTIDIDADVHQVATAEGQVLAACAGGLAVSTDRGGSWAVRTEGLAAPYSRAVAVCGDTVLASSSNGPRGGGAAVYRGDLAGGPLERCRSGLPEWFDDNVDTRCLDALRDGSFAAIGTSDGSLFASEDAGVTWAQLGSAGPAVRCLLVLP